MNSGEVPQNDDVENRRAQLRLWINAHFDGVQAKFVEATDINQGELSGLLKTKSFGEKRARRLEIQAGMPPKYLERRAAPPSHVGWKAEEPPPAKSPHHEWPFKRVSRQQYEQLTPAQRLHVEDTILMLLPIKVKADHRKSASSN